MTTPSTPVPLTHYSRALRRHRVLIAIISILAVVASIVGSSLQKTTYRATASLAFNDVSTDVGVIGVAIAPNVQPEKFAAAQSGIISRLSTAELVKEGYRTPLTAEELRDSLTVSVDTQSNLVDIAADADTAREAADIANAFARTTRTLVTRSERRRYASAARRLQLQAGPPKKASASVSSTDLAYGSAIARLRSLAVFARPVAITAAATVPSGPVSPKPIRNALLALFLGLIMGSALALLRDSGDHRIRSTNQLREILGIPHLGSIRDSALGSAGRANDEVMLDAGDLESFRILRQNVQLLRDAGAPKLILVTSAKPEEGKSTTAAGLAYVHALTGANTLLIDADLRRPSLAKRFGIDQEPGLADFLRAQAAPGEVLRTVPASSAIDGDGPAGPSSGGTLVVIPAGRISTDVSELLASSAFPRLLEQVSDVYDFVVIDSSPLLAVVDALKIASLVDVVIMCARADQTTRDEARAALEAILPANPSAVGFVLTGIPAKSPDEYGHYAYSYGPDPA